MVTVFALIDLPSLHFNLREVGFWYVLHPLRQGHFGHQNYRTLVSLRPVEGLDRSVKRLFHGANGDNRHLHVAMGRVHASQQVRLLRLSGQAGSRTTPLNIYHHQGYLGHPGQSQTLAHQGKAGASGGGHRLLAGESRPQDSRNRFYFRAHLVGEFAFPDQVVLHPYQDGGGRRNGVADVELHSSGPSTQGQCVVSLNHYLRVIGHLRGSQVSHGKPAFGSTRPSQPHRHDI